MLLLEFELAIHHQSTTAEHPYLPVGHHLGVELEDMVVVVDPTPTAEKKRIIIAFWMKVEAVPTPAKKHSTNNLSIRSTTSIITQMSFRLTIVPIALVRSRATLNRFRLSRGIIRKAR